ncbi:type VII secretion-associated serine protease mycosin [Mycobacterium sp. 1274761.0]|uniref:type VII secretion-associated serine protease mycosin n=1 Tax=Mycobacterium sp. 1274761.0 TaxID=1834077 RepID=UPI00350F4623
MLTATFAVTVAACPAAGAVSPPAVDPQIPPPAGTAGPAQPMQQRSPCTATAVLPGTDPGAVNPNQLALNLSDAWQHSRGEGQTVAVIDTGVRPGPRLPNVEAGGDFVESTDGLADCDGHGTLIAGLIAGQPGQDGFSGVAPAARLISIRQTSANFSPRTPGGYSETSRAAADIGNLARAVVRAADLGARVINISVITCVPADKNFDQNELGAALHYAAVDKDAVIVAAAGNNQGGPATGAACESNPPGGDWSGVTSISIPSWWQPYVLSVGSLTPTGQPSPFTMAGPWLGIAAPGENIASVSNADGGGIANALPNDRQELSPLSGSSYAAAYVSGVATLVRSRFPDLTAAQVVRRLTQTAQGAAPSPSDLVGAGGVDPVAALTWQVPPPDPQTPNSRQIAAPQPPQAGNPLPRNVAFAGTGALAVAVLVTATVAHRRKDTSA